MGYSFNDNRAAGGVLEECDTVQCRHCMRHIRKPLRIEGRGRERGVGFCTDCGGAICDPVCYIGCANFLRRIEKAMARDAMLQAMGIGGGP